MHFSSPLSKIIAGLNSDEHAAFLRATYFTLEACVESGDHVLLASIEDAEDAGSYRLHIGLPDRPDMRSVLVLDTFHEAMCTMADLKKGCPAVSQWLSTMEVQAEIRGADTLLGIVEARASMEPDDEDCPWVQVAADLKTGHSTRDVYGCGEHWLYDAIMGHPV